MIEEEKAIFITKNVVFEESDYNILKSFAQRNGYGRHGFSAALRRVIREWAGECELGGEIKPPDDPYERRVMEIMGTPAEKKAAG